MNRVANESQRQKQILSRLDTVGYAECYPGLDEMNDAIDDSDDEADYTKMDMVSTNGSKTVEHLSRTLNLELHVHRQSILDVATQRDDSKS